MKRASIYTAKLIYSLLLLYCIPARAQWNTVYTGSNIFIVEPATQNTWFKSSYYALDVSTNGGATWSNVIPYMTSNNIQEMHVHSATQYWLAGYQNNGNLLGWVARTTDGVTFQYTLTSQAYGYLTDIWFTDASNGFVTTNLGQVLKSVNGGASFSLSYAGSGNSLRALRFLNNNLGIAVGYNGAVVKTTNGGSAWSTLNTGSSGNFQDVAILSAQQYIVAGIDGIYRTTDGGATWNQELTTTINHIHFVNGSVGYATGNDHVFKTTDGGNTWLGVVGPSTQGAYTSVHFFTPQHGYISGYNGIFETNNGASDCPSVNAGADRHVCTQTHPLAAFPNAQNAYQYRWSPGAGLSDSTIANPVASTINPSQISVQTYVVTMSDPFTGCPDVTDTVTITFDTLLFVPHYPWPTNPVWLCQGDTMFLDAADGGVSYTWWLPGGGTSNAPVQVVDTASYFSVQIMDCAGNTHGYYFVVQLTTNCDSVWPGDANYDGIADMYDLLNIGVGYGTYETGRFQISNTWMGWNSGDWPQSFNQIGQNYKHADCNGNGGIGLEDTTAILQNYGQTHILYPIFDPEADPNDPPLYFGNIPTSIEAGDSIWLSINLGSQQIPVNNVYGGAFSVTYDSLYIKPGSLRATFNPSYFGTVNTDFAGLYKNLPASQKIDIGITRINHQNVSGYGEIAQLGFVMQDDISGKIDIQQFLFNALTSLHFTWEKFIDVQENPVNVNPLPVDLHITGTDAENMTTWSVYPNPASSEIRIATDMDVQQVQLYTMDGRLVKQVAHTSLLPVQELARGIYLLQWTDIHGKTYHTKVEIAK